MRRRERPSLATFASGLVASLGEGNGEYEYSSARLERPRSAILGLWRVREHLVGGSPYVAVAAPILLPGSDPDTAVYESSYEFREHICVKRVSLRAETRGEDGVTHDEYRLSLVLEWRLAGGMLRARPASGYQCLLRDGEVVALRELPANPEWIEAEATERGDTLVVKDGDDAKTLERATTDA